MKPEKKRLMLQLLINSILLISLYFIGVYAFGIPMEIIYIIVGTSLGLYFVIYNKGFTRKDVTPDMLPDTMTAAEKQAYIEDGKMRLRKSRWVLTILVPVISAIAIDLCILFLFPQLETLFS